MAIEEPEPEDEPTAVPSDPFERARAAIRAAKEARGVDPDAPDEEELPPGPRDVESVLQRAAAAREQAAVGRAGLEREARAREELARLKGGGTVAPKPAPDDDDAPTEPGPRPRRL